MSELYQPIPFQVGLQVPRSFRAQTAAEGDFRAGAPTTGCDLSRTGPAKGVPDYRGSFDARPCAYVYRNSPKTPRGIGDRVPQGEECDRHSSPEPQGTQFYGEHFWARGYAVSTVGFELDQVRQYIREQEAADGNNGSF